MNSSLIKSLEAIVGPHNLFKEWADLITYAYDAAVLKPEVPALVVRPLTSEALGKVVAFCSTHQIALTVRGAGTNLSGGTIPRADSIVVLTNGLNKILEINTEDMLAVVQPGVVTARLAAAVESKGLFYPPDPGSQAVSTLGGNVAENAGGLRGLKYGVTADYVMGLTFFDAWGNPIKTGSRTVKCATGYNLKALMVGSEGTLGVMDEITLKLIPKPAARQSLLAVFDHMDKASEAVAAIIAHHIVPATLELMDQVTIKAVEAYSHAGFPVDADAILLIEVDGHGVQVAQEGEAVVRICNRMGALSVHVAEDDAQRDRLWAARRGALSALAKLRPTLVLEDATVPRSKIPAMVTALRAIAQKYALTIGTFGHAGDGNLHPTILTDKRDKTEWRRVEAAIEAIFSEALALGGTLSGEHGTGLAKSKFLVDETGAATIGFSRKLKTALDPNHILNPGKIIGG
jgi:glycolate oxidase